MAPLSRGREVADIRSYLLAGCVAVWTPPYTAGTGLTTGGSPISVGQTGSVYITASEMPDGGLGAFQTVGFTFDPGIINITGIEGQNGFEVLVYEFDNINGKAKFALVNPTAGVVRGEIARLTATGEGRGTSDLTWGTVVLGDADNAAITTYDLEDGSILVR